MTDFHIFCFILCAATIGVWTCVGKLMKEARKRHAEHMALLEKQNKLLTLIANELSKRN